MRSRFDWLDYVLLTAILACSVIVAAGCITFVPAQVQPCVWPKCGGQ